MSPSLCAVRIRLVDVAAASAWPSTANRHAPAMIPFGLTPRKRGTDARERASWSWLASQISNHDEVFLPIFDVNIGTECNGIECGTVDLMLGRIREQNPRHRDFRSGEKGRVIPDGDFAGS